MLLWEMAVGKTTRDNLKQPHGRALSILRLRMPRASPCSNGE